MEKHGQNQGFEQAVPDENRRRIVRAWGRLIATVILHYGEQSDENTMWLNCITQVMAKEYTDELINDAMASGLGFTMVCKTVEDLASFGVPRQQQPDLQSVRRENIPDAYPDRYPDDYPIEKRSHEKWSSVPEPELENVDRIPSMMVAMTVTNPAMQFFTIENHEQAFLDTFNNPHIKEVKVSGQAFNDFDPTR